MNKDFLFIYYVKWLFSRVCQNEERIRSTRFRLKQTKVCMNIKQMDSMLPCACSVIDHISDTLGYRLVCHLFVLTSFWRHLWSITEQTPRNMESICLLYNKLSYARILIGFHIWSIGGQTHRWCQRSIKVWQLRDSLNQSQFFAQKSNQSVCFILYRQ